MFRTASSNKSMLGTYYLYCSPSKLLNGRGADHIVEMGGAEALGQLVQGTCD